MPTEEEFEEVKDRLWEAEQQLAIQQEYITKILKQIPEIPERGMARFDSVTWESPSAVMETFLTIRSKAENAPDGYTTREEVKSKLAADNNMLRSEAKGYIKKLLDEGLVETRSGDSSRIRPEPEVSAEDGSDLFVSNFDRADARRGKAESRGKRRDPEHEY